MSVTRTLIFLGVVSTLSVAAHRYVFVRFVRDTRLPASTARMSAALLVVLAFAPIVAMFVSSTLGPDVSRPFVFVAMLWLGAMLYILLGLFVADLARVGVGLALRSPPEPDRRAFLARLVASIVGAGTTALVGYGVPHAFNGIRTRRLRISVPKLAASKSGYRIVQITDVHVGPLIDRAFIESLVARVNALEPDLIAITGDLVDGSVSALRSHVAPLARLRSRDGVFFVTGNHEYYSGADEWIAHLATLGVRTLRNERVAIGGDDGFELAGVDDFRSRAYGHGPDLVRALEGRDRARPVVLLAHQPKQAIEAARLGVDLQLSGHTHAGQLRPFDWFVHLDQPFVVGVHRLLDLRIYVSPGTGFWGPPMRVGTTSEITEILLEHG